MSDPAKSPVVAGHEWELLLREASLEQAIDAIPDAADIFETNKETMRRLGDEGWQALWKE